jgi:hypothetical protein
MRSPATRGHSRGDPGVDLVTSTYLAVFSCSRTSTNVCLNVSALGNRSSARPAIMMTTPRRPLLDQGTAVVMDETLLEQHDRTAQPDHQQHVESHPPQRLQRHDDIPGDQARTHQGSGGN